MLILLNVVLFFSICKTNSNEIFVWGKNDYGQLGISTSTCYQPIKCENWPDNIVDIKCGYSHTLVLTSNGEVFSCGNNHFGQLGRHHSEKFSNRLQKIEPKEFGEDEITRIECGNFHSMCITSMDEVYVFGNNSHGQLGLRFSSFTVNKPLKNPFLTNIVDISSGGDSTFVKNASNEIWAFGDNTYSQLGIESKKTQEIPIQVFQGMESIWKSALRKNTSLAKSARSAKFRRKKQK